METSKAYFEDFLRRFETERRGHTLFQFCRDVGAALQEPDGLQEIDRAKGQVTYFFISPKPVDMLSVSRSQLTLLLAGAVQATLKIE